MEESIPFTKLTNNEFDTFIKLGLESSFIEIINQKESNDIIGVIYRHLNMDVNNSIDEKLDILMHKLSFVRFNFDLLNISSHMETLNFFFNKMTSIFFYSSY